jgi:hypothetical protein
VLSSGFVTICALICSSTFSTITFGWVRPSVTPRPNNTIHWSKYGPDALMRAIQLS